MLTKADIQLGRLALGAGFVSDAQIAECLRLQESSRENKPLGLVLLQRGYLSADQLQTLLETQRREAAQKAVTAREKRADELFGRIVMRLGYATQPQVEEALRVQEQIESVLFLRLGEIMVKKGTLTTRQVDAVVDYQQKNQLTCPRCRTKYNLILFAPGAEIRCYKCETLLAAPEGVSARVATPVADKAAPPPAAMEGGRAADATEGQRRPPAPAQGSPEMRATEFD